MKNFLIYMLLLFALVTSLLNQWQINSLATRLEVLRYFINHPMGCHECKPLMPEPHVIPQGEKMI